AECAMERCPFAPRSIDQDLAFARPALRVHPWINRVVDGEMIGPTHQKACRRPHLRDLLAFRAHAATSGARVRSRSQMTSPKASRAAARPSRAITSGGARRTTV